MPDFNVPKFLSLVDCALIKKSDSFPKHESGEDFDLLARDPQQVLRGLFSFVDTYHQDYTISVTKKHEPNNSRMILRVYFQRPFVSESPDFTFDVVGSLEYFGSSILNRALTSAVLSTMERTDGIYGPVPVYDLLIRYLEFVKYPHKEKHRKKVQQNVDKHFFDVAGQYGITAEEIARTLEMPIGNAPKFEQKRDMTILEQIDTDIKTAMKTGDKNRLSALRDAKTKFTIEATKEGGTGTITDENAIGVLGKLLKQRNEASYIYVSQGREDLADEERAQAEVIKSYLPAQLSEAEVDAMISAIVTETGASGLADMGRVMEVAKVRLAGKADTKVVAAKVKSALS